jgi:hypothetical protein
MRIKFQKNTVEDISLLAPIPAIKSLPEWYKKMSPVIEGHKKQKYYSDKSVNITIKRCNPVGDALSAGYFLLLETDIAVQRNDPDLPLMTWHKGGDNFVAMHGKPQISKDLVPDGFDDQPYKFRNDWSIQTPRGYSVLITHPLNRNAEPFLTLSGIVDTDTHHVSVNLPFLIRNDFEGIIEAGTPIAQVIPFKRENWTSVFLKHSRKDFEYRIDVMARTLHRYYKRFHWKRKEYK